ncbi:MAG: hypothetical protein QY332_09415 [Anaerolineales bacterium]|nr:MAG: hypothetical protein QY332_09415 [Anaerolineales bacterium]
MKKMLIPVILFVLVLSSCLPAPAQPEVVFPTPLSVEDLQATAEIISQQTLQAFPSETPLPSETPVIVTATETPELNTPTETENPILLTLTATLGTGTPGQTLDGPGVTGTLPLTTTPGATLISVNNLTPTKTPHPLFYGTLPPKLPSGAVSLVNKAKVDVYISLRCVTPEGYVTILEYPVKKRVDARAPSGTYTYVAWVGGRQFTGAFSLANDQELLITILKDKITIK